MYLTYEQYQAFGGNLPLQQFGLAEIRARKRIDSLTQGRVARMAQVPGEVRAAMMEIIETDRAFGAAAQASAPAVSGFSTDGYSETYGGVGERTAAAEAQLRRTVGELLYGVTDDDGVPLIYAGVGCW